MLSRRVQIGEVRGVGESRTLLRSDRDGLAGAPDPGLVHYDVARELDHLGVDSQLDSASLSIKIGTGITRAKVCAVRSRGGGARSCGSRPSDRETRPPRRVLCA